MRLVKARERSAWGLTGSGEGRLRSNVSGGERLARIKGKSGIVQAARQLRRSTVGNYDKDIRFYVLCRRGVLHLQLF